jgi:hypothetical protein
LVKVLREKVDQRDFAEADAVNVIGPINKKAAPNHHAQDREVDPVKPADGQGMFLFQPFHDKTSSRVIAAATRPNRRHAAFFILFAFVLWQHIIGPSERPISLPVHCEKGHVSIYVIVTTDTAS